MIEQKKIPYGAMNNRKEGLFPPSFEFDKKNKLWATTFSDSLAFHAYMERYVNKGAYHSYRHYSDVSQEYRPLDGAPSFLLPYVILPEANTRVYEASPSEKLKSSLVQEQGIRFYIHPDMISQYECEGIKDFSKNNIQGEIRVVPTSSTRTMFAEINDELNMVKVDLSGKMLGRLKRQLPERSVVRSNYISKIFEEISDAHGLPDSMAYFPETMGVGMSVNGKSYVNLYREYAVTPAKSDAKYIVPVFSLYSQDVNNPGNRLLIEQLIEVSGLSPEVFFEQKVVYPMIKNALFMAFKHGLLLEAHPQNTLIELDSNFEVSRYIYRDLQTVIVDMDIRAKEGLDTSAPKEAKIMAQWQEGLDVQKEYSIFYDHRIAYQTIEEIIIALAAKYPCHLSLLQNIVKKVFNEVVDELNIDKDKYFPKDSFYLYIDGVMKDNVMKMQQYQGSPYR